MILVEDNYINMVIAERLLEATEEICDSHHQDAKKTPIIVMTANEFAEDAKECS